MEYRNFGRTGMKVSPLCLGCMNFGRRTTPEDSCDIIDRALDVSVTAEDRNRIDELVPPGRMVSPFYEADFGPNLHRAIA